MGLDMYLTKKNYIGAEWAHRNVRGKVEITIGGKPCPIEFDKIHYIIEKVGYWRKANAIHGWFVKNVQGGKDDCKEYYVPFEKLIELKNLCQQAIEAKDPETMLPPTSGFFFGSSEVDAYYREDLKYTIDLLSNLDEKGEYYYQSSW